MPIRQHRPSTVRLSHDPKQQLPPSAPISSRWCRCSCATNRSWPRRETRRRPERASRRVGVPQSPSLRSVLVPQGTTRPQPCPRRPRHLRTRRLRTRPFRRAPIASGQRPPRPLRRRSRRRLFRPPRPSHPSHPSRTPGALRRSSAASRRCANPLGRRDNSATKNGQQPRRLPCSGGCRPPCPIATATTRMEKARACRRSRPPLPADNARRGPTRRPTRRRLDARLPGCENSCSDGEWRWPAVRATAARRPVLRAPVALRARPRPRRLAAAAAAAVDRAADRRVAPALRAAVVVVVLAAGAVQAQADPALVAEGPVAAAAVAPELAVAPEPAVAAALGLAAGTSRYYRFAPTSRSSQ
ncbi:conserved hypothetical protein [Burkholderiales bacterium 8X]|nr:conserved hypothetical protein [Burkholderiales bacterium 8X]